METSLRIVLVLVGLVIVAGIIWDAFLSGRRRPWKSGRNTNNTPRTKNPFPQDWENSDNDLHSDEFDDVILVKSTPKVKNNESEYVRYENIIHENIMHENITNESMKSSERIIEREGERAKLNNPPQDLMILNIMARKPGVLAGRKLLDALNEAHMIYGEMDIFHRHENNDGTGRIIFSLASALEPGTFTLSKMDTFVTPGITLFFNMERPNQSIAAFELMLRSAKQLAMRLDAEIKDDQHKFLTLVTIEKYRDKARQFGVKRSRSG